jgi:hypothetical protein
MPVNLGYTVTGRGGDAFVWLDNSGKTRWSALPTHQFDLFPGAGDDWRSATSGSWLQSTPFKLEDAQTLTVTANILTAHSVPYSDVGFALLMHGAQVEAILFALRPDGINHRGDLGPAPGSVFAAPSAGVTVNAVTGGPVKAMLGGIEYGQVLDPSDCSGTCSCAVTATCAPGAGNYTPALRHVQRR